MKTLLSLILLLLGIGFARADLVPADRLPPVGFWNPGCIGTNGQTYRQSGCFIPPITLNNIINVKTPPYNAVGDGIHDDTTNLQAAIAAGNNSVIYLPTGTYKTTGPLELANPNWPWSWGSKILRGDGMTNTFIKGYGGGPFIDASITSPNKPGNLAQPARRGTNTITLTSWAGTPDNAGNYDTQNWGILYQPNTIAGPPWSYGQAYEANAKCQIIHIVSRNSGAKTITFDPPAYFDWDTNTVFAVFLGSDSSVGVENLSVENMSGAVTHNINFASVFNCWVRGVESKNARKWHVRLQNCARCDVLDSYIHGYYPASGVGGGDSVYGTGIFGQSSDNLVMNNSYDRCRHAMIVEYGDTGNVFAYNYSQNAINEGQEATDFLMLDMCQHGMTQWNLWEGNVAGVFGMDNVLGGSTHNVSFRNYMTRTSLPTVTVARRGYDLQQSNYWVGVIGSVLNKVNAHPSWRVGAPDANGDYVPAWVSPTGTPADPMPTLYVHGVVDLESNLVNWASSNTNRTLPASLWLTNKPAFWDASPWPGIGPDVSGYTNAVPAQWLGSLFSIAANNNTNNLSATNAPAPPTQLKANLLN